MPVRTISGWGLYPAVESEVVSARLRSDLAKAVRVGSPLLPQGNCRSYGDACLAGRAVSLLGLSHLLAFDQQTGLLRAEAGITLDSILQFIVPRGWFLPVTPGTKFPTLGGCIAADVHGKNHHADGAIGRHVEDLEMVLADGSTVHCSRSEYPDLFRATIGGMGLTGFIYAATLRLRPSPTAYIDMRCVKTATLSEACALFRETQDAYTYSVAWIDCLVRGRHLGRSLVMLGNHAREGEPVPHSAGRLSVPFHFPGWVLSRCSVRVFNAMYYGRQWRRDVRTHIHYDPFFYPLDKVDHWNRIYGRRGFLQYQFVIPFADGEQVMGEILDRIAASGIASFLAVLKAMGPEEGLLSFPMAGYTLALDIPLRDGSVIPFIRELNRAVLAAGGRNYLAKDAILTPEEFAAMYVGLDEFRRIKRRYDPDNLFRSLQSDRLGIA